MFDTVRRRFSDAGTLQRLLVSAERHANAEGQTEPGAEHLVMAALEIPGGTARRALSKIGASPQQFRDAVARQYVEALRSVGIQTSSGIAVGDASPVPAAKGVYRAHPSALVQMLASDKPFATSAPLLSAEILIASSAGQHTVAARAFRAMSIDSAALAATARAEIAAYAG